MIKVMTLDIDTAPTHSTKRLQKWIDSLRPSGIDILCCQSIRRSMDGKADITRTLSQSLGLANSCFAASRQQQWLPNQRNNGVFGLTIMTGAGLWILNSGSFLLPGDGEGEEEIVQFALIRKNGTSVLVLNLQIAPSTETQRTQLQALFSHPLLKERYGAVVLCGDRQTALPGKEFQALTTCSNYALHRGMPSAPSCLGNGMMCLLTARGPAISTVSFRGAGEGAKRATASLDQTQCRQPGLTVEFQLDRIPPDKTTRRYLPLSFREQWLGCKDKYPAFAV